VYHFQLDPKVHRTSFEFLLGPSLLVASVFEEGATARSLYLPSAGSFWCDIWTGEWYSGGQDITVNVPLSQCGALLAHAGSLIPTGPAFNYVGEPGADNERLIWCFPIKGDIIRKKNGGKKMKSSMVLIEDDGETMDGPKTEIKIWMEAGIEEVTVGFDFLKAEYDVEFGVIWFVLPIDDTRTLRTLRGDTLKRTAEDGRVHVGLKCSN
jgi:alpha-glucosidase